MSDLLLVLFDALADKQITYCLLRDGERLHELAENGEIDLLVAAHDFHQLRQVLAKLGFVTLSNWGHWPHHFFLIYEEAADLWLKLDVVTEISYGRPVRALRTTLATGCLENRRRQGPTFIPAAEDELVTLLLHCVLDKGRFAPERRHRLQALRRHVSDLEYLSSLLRSYWSPSVSWSQLAAQIEAGEWSALLAQEQTVAKNLKDDDSLATAGRHFRDRLLRKLNHWIGFFHLRIPTVALLAPDGAGKTTLATGIGESSYFPVRSIYMGLYQKQNSEPEGWRPPGLGLMGRILTQWRRYLSARYHQIRSRLVIFDRYTYDSLLTPRRSLDPLRRLRRWLLAHACPPPDLIIVLDAPGKLLYARKGEHSADALEKQRQEYLQLRATVPQMKVVDASQDADTVRRQVMGMIWHTLRKQQEMRGASR